MDYAMLEAQKISNRIGLAYTAALRDINAQLNGIFKNFADGISEAEAKRILQRASLDPGADFLDGLRQAISLVKDSEEKAALIAELNAPAYKARMQRLKALAEDVGEKCDEIARTADSTLDDGLRRIVRDSYYEGVFDMQQRTGIAFSFAKVSERMIKEILQQNWSGKHYSKRVWGNTDELAEQLQRVLMKGVLTGASSGRMANEIQDLFHASYTRALTLTRTESSHCANSAELYRYKDTGVEKYRYVATLDNRTSEICQELDGKEFPVKDAKPGTNYPPMHPRCRSTTIEELSPELMKKLQRRARDPVTGELMTVPGDMTYREWYEKYVGGGELTGEAESGIIETEDVFAEYEKNREQIQKTLHDVETQRMSLKHEVGTVIDREGNIVKVYDGEAHSVDVDMDLADLIFTHNHPSGYCFSSGDIKNFVNDGLLELRASTPQGTFFSIRRTASSVSDPAFFEDYKKIEHIKNAMNQVKEDVKNGVLSKQELKRRGFDIYLEYTSKAEIEFLTKNAEKYGFIFEMGAI